MRRDVLFGNLKVIDRNGCLPFAKIYYLRVMGQTLGSQYLGSWYDTAGWMLAAATFYYFAFCASNFSEIKKRQLPAFLLNKNLCLLFGTCFVAFALFSGINAKSSPPASKSALAAQSTPFQWKTINSNGSGDSISIDEVYLSRKGNLVEYRSKVDFKTPRAVGPAQFASTFIDKYIANCEKQTLSHLLTLAQAKDGSFVNGGKIPVDEQTFLPVPTAVAHPDAILVQYACKK